MRPFDEDGGSGDRGAVPPDGSAGAADQGAVRDSGREAGTAPGADGALGPDAGTPLFDRPAMVCAPSVGLAETSEPTGVVGNGRAESCTERALRQRASSGGVITFDCGPSPVTIRLTAPIVLDASRPTVFDGAHRIILDGGHQTRIFRMESRDFRANRTLIILQRLTLTRGQAPASDFTPRRDGSECAWGYKDGAGGAIYLRDVRLHVIDVDFIDNRAASHGPDVGGGAIYALGSLEVLIVGSRFMRNQGSNGGAVGFLQTSGEVYNSVFEGNRATGEGKNFVLEGCPPFNHNAQAGAGGNGGAMTVDGEEASELLFCGVRFEANEANELGGAVFRTSNADRQAATLERSVVARNVAGTGGGGLYLSRQRVTVDSSVLHGNRTRASAGGGLRTELGSDIVLRNSTFDSNRAETGLAGGLWHAGSGEIVNCTFADNRADGGPGLFSAAIGGGSAARIRNTLFSGNRTADEWNPMACWFEPAPGSQVIQWPRVRPGSNANEDTPCIAGVTWADPMLGPLVDRGGPTRVRVPAEDSPARGAGRRCPATDQLGRPRPREGCALGAFEP